MAEVNGRAANPSLATVVAYPGGGTMTEHQITGLVCGEAIANGDFVYIKASDNKLWKATGAAATEAAQALGIVLIGNDIDKPVTVWHGVNVYLGPTIGGTPVPAGKPLYLSGTAAGRLADAVSTGGIRALARVLDTDGRCYIAPAV